MSAPCKPSKPSTTGPTADVYAMADGIIAEGENLAARVAKPRKPRSIRRTLQADRLKGLCRVADTNGMIWL